MGAFFQVFLKYLIDADWSVCAGNWMWVSSSAFERQLDCSTCICPVNYGKRIEPTGDYIRYVWFECSSKEEITGCKGFWNYVHEGTYCVIEVRVNIHSENKWLRWSWFGIVFLYQLLWICCRRYVPELASLPQDYIFEPWLAPKSVQEAYKCIIGQDYPERIVIHAEASKANRKVRNQFCNLCFGQCADHDETRIFYGLCRKTTFIVFICGFLWKLIMIEIITSAKEVVLLLVLVG